MKIYIMCFTIFLHQLFYLSKYNYDNKCIHVVNSGYERNWCVSKQSAYKEKDSVNHIMENNELMSNSQKEHEKTDTSKMFSYAKALHEMKNNYRFYRYKRSDSLKLREMFRKELENHMESISLNKIDSVLEVYMVFNDNYRNIMQENISKENKQEECKILTLDYYHNVRKILGKEDFLKWRLVEKENEKKYTAYQKIINEYLAKK